ncbi:YidH family protein [Nocardia sp. FBN12]|uniref:YidH family protein n=1 Tax=Nocardia sp. FBN12 TaxID=3419766 RepID=UPI003D0696E8
MPNDDSTQTLEVAEQTIDREPDYRFTLANERTFLAWIRTALALLAGGVAADHLFLSGIDATARTALGLTCVVLATVITLGAFTRWRSVQAAMRRDAPLPRSSMVIAIVLGVAVAAGVCVYSMVR